MKKLLMLFFCIIGLFPNIVKAEEAILEEEYLKGVYFFQVSPNRTIYSHQEAMFKLNGRIAYCLEPDVPASPGSYRVTEGLSGSYLSDEKKKEVEEYGYFGYDYPGHQSINYYLAAQELIWETVSNYEIYWMTREDGNGEEINVEAEKNEILSLIEDYKKLPSFAEKTISLYEGEKLQLEDTNGVLNRFRLDSDLFYIKENTLTSETPKEINIKGSFIPYDEEPTLLYRQENSQKLASLRLSTPISFTSSIKIIGTSMKINKVGEVWTGIQNTGEWKNQNGVEFEIYAEEDIIDDDGNIIYKQNEYIETIVTKSGSAQTRKLPDGKYRLIEVKEKEGYKKAEPVIFEINNSVENDPEIEIKNYLSTGKVEIIKKSNSGNLLSGVVFGLYNKSGKKLDEQITDENGKIVWERLPIGEYQIRELKTVDGFVLDTTKQNIIVKENETLYLEKINVPLLPNTSSKPNNDIEIVVGILGLFISKKLLLS